MRSLLFVWAALLIFYSQSGVLEAAEIGDSIFSRPHGQGFRVDLSDAPSVNEIDLKAIDKFWLHWPMVSVRYRTDKNQIRLVYANSLAWEALNSGSKNFPDGAILGKLVFNAKNDDAFPVSMGPREFVRFQLMFKNKAKYPRTDGWGYAIYAGQAGGRSISVDKSEISQHFDQACHACHAIVAKSDFVFSKPIYNHLDQAKSTETDVRFLDRFKTTSLTSLNQFQKSALMDLRPAPNFIELQEILLFRGSLAESLSSLASYVADDKKTYLLTDSIGGFYVLASPAKTASAKCENAVNVTVCIPNEWGHNSEVTPIKKSAMFCGETFMWE